MNNRSCGRLLGSAIRNSLTSFSAVCVSGLATLMVPFGGSAAPTPYKPPSASPLYDASKFRKKMDIGIWSPNYVSTKRDADTEYRLIAEAGINLIWSDRYDNDALDTYKLDLCKQLGLRAIVPLWVEPKATKEAQGADAARWKAIVKKFKDHPAVIGFDMRDEPPYPDLEILYGAREIIESQLPAGKFAICNLHPSWQTDKRYTGPLGYEHYLAIYMRGVKPRILSFDNYPLREANATVDVQTSAIREFINNLVLMRREALEAQIPFWGFIQSVGWPDNRLPTKNEMRWLNNMHLVFGADGFSYFLWADTDFYTGEPVTSQHLPTTRYDLIKQLNQEFRAYDFMVVPFHQNGFIVRNLDEIYLEAIPKSLQRATFGAVKAIETQGQMINGCFDFQGLKAVYLFNFDMVDPTHARVDFKSRTRFELWGKGGRGLEKTNALSLEIFLEPGEGKLLVFRD